MGLDVERLGDVVVVIPEGMLKGGKETEELRNALRKLVDDGEKKILLDLARTSYMSSMPFGVLASVHRSAVSSDVQFCLCSVNERIQKVWSSILNLVKPPLELYETRAEALHALSRR